jgi:hypothetical protein
MHQLRGALPGGEEQPVWLTHGEWLVKEERIWLLPTSFLGIPLVHSSSKLCIVELHIERGRLLLRQDGMP